MPGNIDDANKTFDGRKMQLVRIVLTHFDLSEFSGDNLMQPYAKIAAGLTALKEQMGVGESSSFPQDVESWTDGIDRGRLDPGTWIDPNGRTRSDLDMHMIRLISLLYLFKQDSDLLTDTACQNIINEIFRKYVGQKKWKDYMSGVFQNPETENHVLMTLSSIYLMNQWIKENPRNFNEEIWKDVLGRTKWRKLTADDALKNSGTELEKKLLQAAGRILHSGYFETNATAYQSKSIHSLLNLYSFSDSAKMRTAALNALNYTMAKFAFQSFEGRRWSPKRRNHEYAAKLHSFAHDSVISMMAALSGTYDWVSYCPGQACTTAGSTANGSDLFAILLNYRLPFSIHDFMLNKHTGYWARMQARYDSNHYHYGEEPRYFESDGAISLDENKIESAPEFYFATSHFLNNSGGAYNRLPVPYDTRFGVRNGVHYYDFLSRPQTLFARINRLTDGADIQDNVLHMLGAPDKWWASNNSGSYKSFSYGYRSGVGYQYPMSIPSGWGVYRYTYEGRQEFSKNPNDRVRFQFFDLTARKEFGFFVIAGRVSKDLEEPRYRQISRGFWEIVPKRRFGSIEELVAYVLNNNCCDAFSNGRQSSYQYKMTTGETLVLDPTLGSEEPDQECRPPILKVKNREGEVLDIAKTTYACTSKAIAEMPLMEVREVDANYRFTGRIFAQALGDGRLTVMNPFVGEKLVVDSSDYLNPRTERSSIARTCGHCVSRQY